jgi:CRISPR-associated protein Cas2
LKDYGIRVQHSVFECRLEESRFITLRSKLADLLQKNDSIRWYPLCRWCRVKISRQGEGISPNDEKDEGFIIT